MRIPVSTGWETNNAGSGPLDRKLRFGGDRPFAIERTAEGIDDAAEQPRPDRQPNDLAGASDPRAGLDGIAFVEQHRADRFGVERSSLRRVSGRPETWAIPSATCSTIPVVSASGARA